MRTAPGRAFKCAEGGVWRSQTWAEVDAAAREIAGGLAPLGVAPGDAGLHSLAVATGMDDERCRDSVVWRRHCPDLRVQHP